MDQEYLLELTNLIRVSWILLIPVGVLLVMVLYKLVMLLHSVSEFLTLAQYELSPAIKDLRLTAAHVETISAKAASSVEAVERGIQSTKPAIDKGVHSVRAFPHALKVGIESLMNGLKNSFSLKR